MNFYILLGFGHQKVVLCFFVGLSWSGNNDVYFMIFS
jgi:hypothetical protein